MACNNLHDGALLQICEHMASIKDLHSLTRACPKAFRAFNQYPNQIIWAVLANRIDRMPEPTARSALWHLMAMDMLRSPQPAGAPPRRDDEPSTDDRGLGGVGAPRRKVERPAELSRDELLAQVRELYPGRGIGWALHFEKTLDIFDGLENAQARLRGVLRGIRTRSTVRRQLARQREAASTIPAAVERGATRKRKRTTSDAAAESTDS